MSTSETYNDSHRACLEAFWSRGSWTYADSRALLAGILTAHASRTPRTDSSDNPDVEPVGPEDISEQIFNSFTAAAAETVAKYDFQIRSTVHQISGERVWAIVNTTSDFTQDATQHTPEEMAFIKRVLEAMFDSYNTPRAEVMAITSMQALKLARPRPQQQQQQQPQQPQQPQQNGASVNPSSDDGDGENTAMVNDDTILNATTQTTAADKGLKLNEAEAVLGSLVSGGWFELSPAAYYSLTPRALMELRAWLLATFNDPDVPAGEWQRIKSCEACRDIITTGQRCGNRDCIVRLHDRCEDAYWRTRRDKNCPRCERPWDGGAFVGERAVIGRAVRGRSG